MLEKSSDFRHDLVAVVSGIFSNSSQFLKHWNLKIETISVSQPQSLKGESASLQLSFKNVIVPIFYPLFIPKNSILGQISTIFNVMWWLKATNTDSGGCCLACKFSRALNIKFLIPTIFFEIALVNLKPKKRLKKHERNIEWLSRKKTSKSNQFFFAYSTTIQQIIKISRYFYQISSSFVVSCFFRYSWVSCPVNTIVTLRNDSQIRSNQPRTRNTQRK